MSPPLSFIVERNNLVNYFEHANDRTRQCEIRNSESGYIYVPVTFLKRKLPSFSFQLTFFFLLFNFVFIQSTKNLYERGNENRFLYLQILQCWLSQQYPQHFPQWTKQGGRFSVPSKPSTFWKQTPLFHMWRSCQWKALWRLQVSAQLCLNNYLLYSKKKRTGT